MNFYQNFQNLEHEQARQTQTQTNATERIITSYSWVVP